MATTNNSTHTKDFHLIVFIVLIVSGLILLYYKTFIGLVYDWQHNDNFSHGFFIPLISGFMIYTLRKPLHDIPFKPFNSGLLLLLLGLCQLIIARIGSEFFLDRTSLILVLLGLSLFLFGIEWTKKVKIPIFYLIFMIPLPEIIWNRIAFPMQLFASYWAEIAIQFLGIPIFRQGNVLHLSNTTLEVVDACSGLRSLVTMFALSALVTWFMNASIIRKWILFFAAIPIAVLANIIRLTVTAMLASQYGENMAQGFLHDFSGLLIFAFGLSLLMFVNYLLTKIHFF